MNPVGPRGRAGGKSGGGAVLVTPPPPQSCRSPKFHKGDTFIPRQTPVIPGSGAFCEFTKKCFFSAIHPVEISGNGGRKTRRKLNLQNKLWLATILTVRGYKYPTGKTQNPVWATMCGFKSRLRYYKQKKDLRRFAMSPFFILQGHFDNKLITMLVEQHAANIEATNPASPHACPVRPCREFR